MNVQCLIFWIVINAYGKYVFGNIEQMNKFKTNNENPDMTSYPTETAPPDIESKTIFFSLVKY